MPRDAGPTRERIIQTAHRVILERGFASTSIDDITERAGISRGTFFYHFATKDDLARTLIHRHAAEDRELAERFMERAEGLARDPLQQLLIFFGLYIELVSETTAERPPGCLFASFSYEAGVFDEDTMRTIREAFDFWRELVGAKIGEAARAHPPDRGLKPHDLADFAYTVFEGGMIMARVRGNPQALADQLILYRDYLEHLFGVASAAAGA